MEPILLSWSGGKDSALTLHRLSVDPKVAVVGLLTTITAEYDRVSIHGVRRDLLHRQAAALGLPLHEIQLTPQSSNKHYQDAWKDALDNLTGPMQEARTIAYGDIFLEDVRSYRETLAQDHGYKSVFPLWGESTRALAEEVLDTGIDATLVCVDTQALAADFVGRAYDENLIASLPMGVDCCGERGEFHTFVSSMPEFDAPVRFSTGDTVIRDQRFAFCDLVPVMSA